MHELFLVTNKFTIRPFRTSDASAIRKNIQDEKIFENTLHIPRPYLLKHAKEHIAKNLRQYRLKKPTGIGYVIEVQNEAAGAIGFTFRGSTGELGYWLAKQHRRKGITSAAVKLFTEHLFLVYKLKKIEAYISATNDASRGVLLNNDFIKVGDIRRKKGKVFRPEEHFEKKNLPRKV